MFEPTDDERGDGALDADGLLEGLDESQRAAVVHESELVAISAPAGSGKTRTLTRRIAWRCATERSAARRVLAVTYTRKAAGELRTRLAGPLACGDVTAGTFHSIALAQLRRRANDRGKPFPGLLDRKAQLLAPLVGGRGPAATVAIKEIAAEIEWAKARALTPGDYTEAAENAQRPLPRPAAEITDLYERYEQSKRRQRLIDFDDVLWWCADAFNDDTDFAAAQRFRFRHLYVDEFQDITPAQLRLLRAWLGGRRDLTVVGDDAQAIYGFAGAQPHALDRFDRLFPGAALLRLSTNYRSSRAIVLAADAVLDGATVRRRPTPNAARPDGVAPTVRAFADDVAEARGVAQSLRDAHNRSVPWREMAVLYRTNAQSGELETALQKMSIPFRVRGSGRFLDRPEVRVVLGDLRDGDRRHPGRPLSDHVRDLAETAAELQGEQREHVDAVAQLAQEYIALDGGQGTVGGFLGWLATSARGDVTGTGADAVELSTFHAAKGLEWEAVFVTGVEVGLVPISYARTTEARAEEQRLLHVALSRAATELHVSWARQRTRPRKPSPWLVLVEECVASGGAAARRNHTDPKKNLARTKAALAAHAPGPPADAHVLDALKTWRRNLARAHDLPAFTIFNDATLTAIATTLPANRTSLLDVHGVGPSKLERYGTAVLDIVAQRAREPIGEPT